MTKEVSSQVQSKKKESASNKEKENKDKPSKKESDSSEDDNDNDVAYLSPVWNKHTSPSNPSRKTQVLETHRLNEHGLLRNGLLIFRRSRRHHVGDIEAEIRGKNVGNVLYASAPPRTSTPHVVHPNEVLLLVAAIIDKVRVVERVVHRPREHAVPTPHAPARRLTAP